MPIRLGVPELVLILVIVILLFGVGRIGKIAGELGTGIRAFREGLKSSEEKSEEKKPEEKNE
ncbi:MULTISPECIES: twin-arginine translocase TatA/TatE family subunit [Anaerolinea]|uniref:twin-arginine translocase TatA/TatE family subunit n=1 Tax=Anaerolinea TaxID=233189 RepID=UPI0026122B1C|nr:twin-arginine translocase TatA/TatE family subunit [Anaerolinea thermophila]